MIPKFRFELTGVTPLLIHADDVMEADRLKEWLKNPENKKVSVPGDDRTPPWTWQTYLYSDGEHLSIPADNIMKALLHAAAKITLQKQTSYKSLSQSGLCILEEHCALTGPKGQVPYKALRAFENEPFAVHAEKVKKYGFALFVKRAKLNTSKVVRVRPRFEEWSVGGTISITDPAITKEVLIQMFNLAGTYAGLCDWRPSSKQSPGPYGRFEAKLTAA